MRKIEFDRPLWIAAHFGFRPIETPSITPLDFEKTSDCEEKVEKVSGKFLCNAPEKAAFLRHYVDKKLVNLPHPLALSWRRGRDYSLELVGYPIGIAEAKLIRTSLSILVEEGYKGLVVEINSIGDKDSIASYEKELNNYIKKVGIDLSGEMKKLLKEDIFAIAKAHTEEAEKLRKEMPSSVASLSAQSRSQFKEVIEFLEALGVEYRFAPELIGHKNLCSETLFAIRDETNSLLAAGYRYSRLSKRFGFKKELSLIGATVFGEKPTRLDSRSGGKAKEKKVYKEAPKPKFYLVHLGRDARMKALPMIEMLRSSRIAIHHLLGSDKLVAQMETADRVRAPYLLIVGQKEAIENTVTVRNVDTRAQDTIPLETLPDYLRHLPF
ncbi:MAG: His/Gly/Thr/Pro-type tRNA ligase C-terminal domain-containing protein [Minisyncoccota bacterium]